MGKKPVDTVSKILSEDDKKNIAEKLLDPSVDEIIIIYRKDGKILWETNCSTWAVIFGAMEMARMVMEGEWHQESASDEEA